ncbi:MAG TPA: hypothetical protein VG318_03550 [Actinomycetota bacterium]|nr:hypothetical protein [Actinomycetota bacterium]
MDRPDEEQQNERPRPKVVDKRISARSAEGAAERASAAAPTAEVTVGSVPETPAEPSGPPEPEAEAAPRGPGERVWTPEEEAEARRVAQEIAQTPSIEWVVNTAATLANVAGTKLDLGAAADAQLAIDALAGLVNAVGPRLQGAEMPLRQLLADLQLAYAERMAGPGSGPGG